MSYMDHREAQCTLLYKTIVHKNGPKALNFKNHFRIITILIFNQFLIFNQSILRIIQGSPRLLCVRVATIQLLDEL